ncbi:expansin-like protein B1, partial [Sesbania bispinosa]
MDVVLHYMFSLILLHSLLLNPCYCLLHRKLFNASKIQNDDQWETAAATWYGAPDGAGTD